MSNSLVGRKLGMYEIVDMLGHGGMATVYKGYRPDIDRYVAVKVLPPHPGMDKQFIERFQLEAKTIARLQHPHILPLYDYGVEDDILYLVMAYIEGGSLSGKIKRGNLQLKEIERLLRQIATAMDYAHRQGIVHRDIKPDNILLDKEGNALLADFGIVKIAEGESKLTVTGGLVGTPAYMAPEQATGETNLTGSADLYSLGVVVYEMLTGKQPYTADTPMQVAIKHITEPVPNPRNVVTELPVMLDTVMQRVLAKNPQNRHKTAVEFADDFASAIQGEEAFARVAIDFQPSPDPTRLNPADSSSAAPVVVPTTAPVSTGFPTPIPTQQQPTTVIVQQSTNPLLLLGGFAVIAVLLVGVVLLVLNNQSSQTGNQQPTATKAATQAVIAAAPTATEVPSFGRLSFSTTKTMGDTVTLQVENLVLTGEGQQYVAWLKNLADDSILKIGELTLDAAGNGVLPPYVDTEGRILPAFYNAIAITLEDAGGAVSTPNGPVTYSASVPAEMMTALRAIFITDENGIAVSALQSGDYTAPVGGGPTAGLLASALGEASRGRQHAGLAQLAGTVGGMHTHNEHSINILLGTKDDYNGDSSPQNPGFGKGIPLYLDAIQDNLVTAATAPGSTGRLQSQIELVRVCLDNTRQRVDRIVELEKEMLAAADVESVKEQADESTTIAAEMINGADTNGNGQVEPFEGECGLKDIERFGLLISAMLLAEGPLAG